MKITLLALLPLVLSACSTVSTLTEKPAISLEEFNQLQNGITIEQAEKIVGAKSVVFSESKVGNVEIKIVQWANNGGISNANATFQNGKLMGKAQFGLK